MGFDKNGDFRLGYVPKTLRDSSIEDYDRCNEVEQERRQEAVVKGLRELADFIEHGRSVFHPLDDTRSYIASMGFSIICANYARFKAVKALMQDKFQAEFNHYDFQGSEIFKLEKFPFGAALDIKVWIDTEEYNKGINEDWKMEEARIRASDGEPERDIFQEGLEEITKDSANLHV